LSLWIEALCIHEWCLFTERVQQENQQKVHRGSIYQLLTDRPDNRRPLTMAAKRGYNFSQESLHQGLTKVFHLIAPIMQEQNLAASEEID